MDNGYGGNSMAFLATLTCYSTTIKDQIENDAKGKVK